MTEIIPFPTLFDQWIPHWVGVLLGTGYVGFTSPFGVEGLARVDGATLHFLALVATKPRTGQLTRFMREAQHVAAEIYVWAIWNDDLRAALTRWGFEPAPDTAEETEGMRWHR